jgi:hypothetical protein
MKTETKTELQQAADRAGHGTHDPTAMAEALEAMRARVEAAASRGTEPFAAKIIRQIRGTE